MRWIYGHDDELAIKQFDMLIPVDDPGALHGADLAIGETANAEFRCQFLLQLSLRQNTHVA